MKIKPAEISGYNTNMSGIDRADQMINYYTCPRKTIRFAMNTDENILCSGCNAGIIGSVNK